MLSKITSGLGNILKSLKCWADSATRNNGAATLGLILTNLYLFPILQDSHTFSMGQLPSWSGFGNLFLSMFSHSGTSHLFGNMLFLSLCAPAVEKALGSAKFLLTYLVCGVGAAIGFGMFYPDAHLLGASGAVSGILVLAPFVQPRLLLTLALGAPVGFYFVQNFIVSITQFITPFSNVANLAHVAGAVTGLIMFCFFKRK